MSKSSSPKVSNLNHNWIVLDGYAIVEKIGTGSYSTVYKGFKTNGSRNPVAVKCVEKLKLSSSGVDNIITEIRMMKMLRHEYIVEMKEFQWDDRFIYIILEYCDGGDLSCFIKRRRSLPEPVCRRFMQQLAVALKFLRSHNISHLDLKPQNLLLCTQPALTLKVADFGFAQFLSSEARQNSLRGSPLYMAPEMLLTHQYDTRADLWSVGVIAYECLFGRAPYSSTTFRQLADKITAQTPIEIPECSVSRDCRDLLTGLLQHDPACRLGYDALFAHPFLDLEHRPTPDSFATALDLVRLAVSEDTRADYSAAFPLYCDALRYLIPHVQAEENEERKKKLRDKVLEYTRRAEKLKEVLYKKMGDANRTIQQDSSCTPQSNRSGTDKSATGTDSSGKPGQSPPSAIVTTTPSSNTSQSLWTLCATTPVLASALEIGATGQLYLAEGQYRMALDKLQASLGMLVAQLGSEPAGPRRDLLHRQVEVWMKLAENAKALQSYAEVNQANTMAAADSAKGKERRGLRLLRYLALLSCASKSDLLKNNVGNEGKATF